MEDSIQIAIVGYGKIAKDAHVPAIAATEGVRLCAVVSSRDVGPPGIPQFKSLAELQASGIPCQAVSLCTRPVDRTAFALEALDRGWHVMLEKPPAETLAHAERIVARAREKNRAVMATWHARENEAVDRAAELLKSRTVQRIDIVWHEDVNKWHPGQEWVWQPGGFGVFDPGINALSILTRIFPRPLTVTAASFTRPDAKPMPITAQVTMEGPGNLPVTADLDWRPTPTEDWTITIQTDQGEVKLLNGGATLHLDGQADFQATHAEYERLYSRFAPLCRAGGSEADLTPMALVEQAFAAAR